MVSAWNKSLYLKQALATLLLAVVLSLVLSFVKAYNSLSNEPERIHQEFNDVLSLVELPMSQALFRLDRALGQQQVESLLYHPAIRQVTVYDESHSVFAQALAPRRHTVMGTELLSSFLPSELKITRALEYDRIDIPLGNIVLELDTRYLTSQILSTHLAFFAENLVKDILLASMLSMLFYLLLTRPVRQLTQSLKKVDEKANIDLPAGFERWHQNDELGTLRTTFRDIWLRLRNALDALEQSHQHSKAMISHAADGIIVINRYHEVIVVNEAAERLFGFNASDLKHQRIHQLGDKTFWSDFEHSIDTLDTETVFTIETTLESYATSLPVEIRASKYLVHGEQETVLLVRDLSERKEAQQRINRLSFYDSLTRLPNRSLVIEQLETSMQHMKESEFGALIILDLDRFKTINDALGHNIGDQLLVKLVDDLMPLVPPNTTFARIGGDEFVFLWNQVRGEMAEDNLNIVNFVQRILFECAKQKVVRGHDLHVTASLGVSFFDGTEESPATILRQADTALYKAKEQGRNTFAFFQEGMQSVSDARLKLERALHRALEGREFEVYYQPQNDVDGALIGAEALLRWRDPDLGFISPMEFIPVAEDIGLIHDIGRLVLERATIDVATWRQQGVWLDEWKISVNVSPLQFSHNDLIKDIELALDKSQLPPSMLDIEITENMLMANVEDAISKMVYIRSLGISLSVDDFGTGYSSLKYLKDLPIDRLKIDQSFVRDLTMEQDHSAIVKAIIAMANALELNVLAEGVETEAHFHYLESIGCYSYQGYFFSKPLPHDAFKDYCVLLTTSSSE